MRKGLYPTEFVLRLGTQHLIDFSINRQGTARGYTYNPYNKIVCDPESEVDHASETDDRLSETDIITSRKPRVETKSRNTFVNTL